jgi:hypothetical protein
MRLFRLGNRYLNLEALAEVRLDGELVILTFTSGKVRDVPIDLADGLLAWCESQCVNVAPTGLRYIVQRARED